MNAFSLYRSIRERHSIEDIATKLSLNKGTLRRWEQQQKVPQNYLNDLRSLTDKPPKKREQDEFFTTQEVAAHCYLRLLQVLRHLDICEHQKTFIEPSVGAGAFYDLLPKSRRLGIDLKPTKAGILEGDFLNFWPEDKNKRYLVVGNPPFGLRGNLALRFINHAKNFADVVGFILPPLFDSDGKGSPMKRVVGYQLAHSERLPRNAFQTPDGTKVFVATLFQVWTCVNTHKIERNKKPSCKSFLRVYSLSDGGTPASTRNKNMLTNCDVYLPSTCFRGMRAYDNFEDLPHRRGYGIKIFRRKASIKNACFKKINWEKVAFLSTNSALNLRASLIEQAIAGEGFVDAH